MKKHSPVLIFSIITIILFILYDKYLIKFIMFFKIPYAPNTRTVQAAVTKYLPVITILVVIYYIWKRKLLKEQERRNNLKLQILGTALRPFMDYIVSKIKSNGTLSNIELERLVLDNHSLVQVIELSLGEQRLDITIIVQIYIEICSLFLKNSQVVEVQETQLVNEECYYTLSMTDLGKSKDEIIIVVSDNFETEFCGEKPDIIIPEKIEIEI